MGRFSRMVVGGWVFWMCESKMCGGESFLWCWVLWLWRGGGPEREMTYVGVVLDMRHGLRSLICEVV